uniref:Uncharacterized protein n=1 Tax=Arundo donax TaxID=35708 RepID=A0A0A9FRI5_ARUDO
MSAMSVFGICSNNNGSSLFVTTVHACKQPTYQMISMVLSRKDGFTTYPNACPLHVNALATLIGISDLQPLNCAIP